MPKKKEKYIVVGNRVAVTPLDDSPKSDIYIPNADDEPKRSGKVVAIGDDIDEDRFEIGDIIIYTKHAAEEVEISDGEKISVVDVDDVLIIKPQNNA